MLEFPELSHSRNRRVDELLGEVLRSDIAADRDRLSSRGLDLLNHCLRLLCTQERKEPLPSALRRTASPFAPGLTLVQIRDDDLGTLGGKQERRGPADALRGTRDYGDFTVRVLNVVNR